MFMSRLHNHKKILLMNKIYNGGWTKLHEWVEKIVENFHKEKSIEERTSLDDIMTKFCNDLTQTKFCNDLTHIFFSIIPSFLYKFLIEKGVIYIVKPRPPLVPSCTNWEKRQNE